MAWGCPSLSACYSSPSLNPAQPLEARISGVVSGPAAKASTPHKTPAPPDPTALSYEWQPDGGPLCGQTYEFRAFSHGDGTTYLDRWGNPYHYEDSPKVTTPACEESEG